MSSAYDPGQPTGGPGTADAPSVPAARAGPAAGQATQSGGMTAGYTEAGQQPYGYEEGVSGAAEGFTILAACLMILGGLWSFFAGLAGVIHGSFYVVTHSNYVYNISTTGWGVINIVIGSVVFLAGCALFTRQTWARIVAVALAGISAVVNFLFIPRYPFWAILVIALDIVIIWAVTRSGRSSRREVH